MAALFVVLLALLAGQLVEDQVYDELVYLRGESAWDSRLMVVFARGGERSLAPSRLGELAGWILRDGGARLLVADVLFEGSRPGLPAPGSEAEVARMLEGFESCRRYVFEQKVLPIELPLVFVHNADGGYHEEALPAALQSLFPVRGYSGFAERTVVRSVYPWFRGVPALAVRAVAQFEALGRGEASAQMDPNLPLSLEARVLEAAGRRRLWIDYSRWGIPQNYFALAGQPILAVADLQDPSYRKKLLANQTFRDRLVFLGVIDSATDSHLTPVRPLGAGRVPGLLLQANLANSLLTGETPYRAALPITALMTLAGFCGGAALSCRFAGRRLLVWACAASVAYAVLVVWAAVAWTVYVSLVAPLIGFVGGCVASVLGSRVRVWDHRSKQAGGPTSPPETWVLSVHSLPPVGAVISYSYRLEPSGDGELVAAGGAALEAHQVAVAERNRLLAEISAFDPQALGRRAPEVLQSIGTDLSRSMVGTDLVARLGLLPRRTLLRLDLSEDDAIIPWECLVVQNEMLQRRFALGRRLLFPQQLSDSIQAYSASRRAESHPRALFIADPVHPGKRRLLQAVREVEKLRHLFIRAGIDERRIVVLEGEEATFAGVRKVVSAGPVGLLHYSGHTVVAADAPDQTGMLLADGVLSPAGIRDHFAGRCPRLVYLNSCQSGAAIGTHAAGYRDLANIPKAFVRAGVQSFMGCLWVVEDTAATTLGLSFYEAILQGKMLGEALLLRRSPSEVGRTAGLKAYSTFTTVAPSSTPASLTILAWARRAASTDSNPPTWTRNQGVPRTWVRSIVASKPARSKVLTVVAAFSRR
ncbi:MAG: CHAT domain-containing protein [Candidatus Riflebacteria bacterium]|nr:CHAT domain-containing protein [Candidatus Riflebacteria bacterium]